MIVSNTQRHDHAFVHLYARTYLACNCKVAFDHCGHEGRQTRLWTMILQQIRQRNSYRCGTKMISRLRVTGLESFRPAYALCNDLRTTFRQSCLQSDVRSVRQDKQKAVCRTAICDVRTFVPHTPAGNCAVSFFRKADITALTDLRQAPNTRNATCLSRMRQQ